MSNSFWLENLTVPTEKSEICKLIALLSHLFREQYKTNVRGHCDNYSDIDCPNDLTKLAIKSFFFSTIVLDPRTSRLEILYCTPLQIFFSEHKTINHRRECEREWRPAVRFFRAWKMTDYKLAYTESSRDSSVGRL